MGNTNSTWQPPESKMIPPYERCVLLQEMQDKFMERRKNAEEKEDFDEKDYENYYGGLTNVYEVWFLWKTGIYPIYLTDKHYLVKQLNMNMDKPYPLIIKLTKEERDSATIHGDQLNYVPIEDYIEHKLYGYYISNLSFVWDPAKQKQVTEVCVNTCPYYFVPSKTGSHHAFPGFKKSRLSYLKPNEENQSQRYRHQLFQNVKSVEDAKYLIQLKGFTSIFEYVDNNWDEWKKHIPTVAQLTRLLSQCTNQCSSCKDDRWVLSDVYHMIFIRNHVGNWYCKNREEWKQIDTKTFKPWHRKIYHSSSDAAKFTQEEYDAGYGWGFDPLDEFLLVMDFQDFKILVPYEDFRVHTRNMRNIVPAYQLIKVLDPIRYGSGTGVSNVHAQKQLMLPVYRLHPIPLSEIWTQLNNHQEEGKELEAKYPMYREEEEEVKANFELIGENCTGSFNTRVRHFFPEASWDMTVTDPFGGVSISPKAEITELIMLGKLGQVKLVMPGCNWRLAKHGASLPSSFISLETLDSPEEKSKEVLKRFWYWLQHLPNASPAMLFMPLTGLNFPILHMINPIPLKTLQFYWRLYVKNCKKVYPYVSWTERDNLESFGFDLRGTWNYETLEYTPPAPEEEDTEMQDVEEPPRPSQSFKRLKQ